MSSTDRVQRVTACFSAREKEMVLVASEYCEQGHTAFIRDAAIAAAKKVLKKNDEDIQEINDRADHKYEQGKYEPKKRRKIFA